MKIHQMLLSNVVSDFQVVDQMLNVDSVEMQAEFYITKTNVRGEKYTGDVTPWAYFEKRNIKPFAYFDFMWPNPWEMSAPLDAVTDPYWLRKKHIAALREHPEWTRPSPDPERPYSNTANRWYCDWLINLLLDTDIPRWRFDDCHIHKYPRDVVDGMFYVFSALRDYGCEVWANNSWHMDNPTDDPKTWGYRAWPWLDGIMIEHWASHNDGFSWDGSWWALTDDRMQQVQEDWVNGGKGVMVLVRWRPGETPYADYDSFCRHYIEMAESTFVPCLHNYYYPNYLDWFRDYQDTEKNIETVVQRECDARQQILLNPNAALQKVIYAEGGVPVLNEFEFPHDGKMYIMQKSEKTGVQEERYHYAPTDNYNDVKSFTKPHVPS